MYTGVDFGINSKFRDDQNRRVMHVYVSCHRHGLTIITPKKKIQSTARLR